MYWVVLACALLVESWTSFILEWYFRPLSPLRREVNADIAGTSIPFYAWIRAGFLLYLIAPQTQGARVLYQEQVHPFLREHEIAIEAFISSAHDRVKRNSLKYLKQGVGLLKQYLLGIPPQPSPPPSPTNLSFTQALITRFNIPNYRPAVPIASAGASTTATTADFYTLLASAVSAASTVMTGYQQGSSSPQRSGSGTLIPSTVRGAERMPFIAAQRERLLILLSALDKEAQTIKTEEISRTTSSRNLPNVYFDGTSNGGNGEGSEQARPPSAMSGISSAMSGISRSRSEPDFERIEADEEQSSNSGKIAPEFNRHSSGTGGWLPWSWGSMAAPTDLAGAAKAKGERAAPDAVMETPAASTGARTDQGKSSGIDI